MNDSILAVRQQRNVSLDFLRVISMIMIVVLHCLGHDGTLGATKLYSFEYFSGWTLEAFCYVAVNCYVLISGYFLCEGKFKLNKLLTLYGSTWLWSVALFVIFVAAGIADLSAKNVIKAFLPFTQCGYWFVTTYLLMYILCPFLNIAIHAMNKRQHAAVIAVFFGVYIVLQNISFWREFTLVGQNDPMFFIFLYFVSAYIRRYPPEKKRFWIFFYAISSLLTAASRPIITYVTTIGFGKSVYETMFFSYNSILTVVGSISLFLFFYGLDIKNKTVSKIITFAAPLTFGVYLIHENVYLKVFLWQSLVKPDRYAENPWMILLVLGISLGVFAVCCCIEKIRLLLRKWLHIDRAVNWLAEKSEKIFEKICMARPIRAFWVE